MTDSRPDATPVQGEDLAELVAVTLLSTFPLSDEVASPSGPDVTPRAIRRAAAYIEEHLAEPLSVTRIADAANSPRAPCNTGSGVIWA